MTHYLVYTPQFTDYGNPLALEPPEVVRDCVEVEASTKREAKVLAVREMRRQRMMWVGDQESDGASPFSGLRVDDMTCDHGKCHCSMCGGACTACMDEYLDLDGT